MLLMIVMPRSLWPADSLKAGIMATSTLRTLVASCRTTSSPHSYWPNSSGLDIFFRQAVKFDRIDWIPVVEGGHLTVFVPFLKIICNINSLFFPNYLFKNVFLNDSVQRGLRCIDCHTSVTLYTCTDKIFKNQIILNNII